MKKWHIVVLIVAVAVLSAGVGAYAASNYGSQSDPLITLSYLNETLKPSMITAFDSQADKAMEKLENQFASDISSATGSFRAVTVSKGQTLTGGEGTEILFRAGTASASGGIVDMSSGTAVKSGAAVTANHLYICPSAGTGVTASADATMMVRGGYTVA